PGQVSEAYVIQSGFAATSPGRTLQQRAPLDEPGPRAGNLRAAGIGVARAPVAPGHVGPFAVAAARLQLNWPGAAPPNLAPRRHQLRVTHRRFITSVLDPGRTKANQLALIARGGKHVSAATDQG